jgi:hypothetical protein
VQQPTTLPDRNPEEYLRVNESFKKLRMERRLKDEQEKAFAEALLADQKREVVLKEAEEDSRLHDQVRSTQQIRFSADNKSDFQQTTNQIFRLTRRSSAVRWRLARHWRRRRPWRSAGRADPPGVCPLSTVHQG